LVVIITIPKDNAPCQYCGILSRCCSAKFSGARSRRNFVIDEADWGLAEALVCEAHGAALKAGERYIYNSEENIIYMGQDVPPESSKA